jgi:hypothetical protein
MNRRQSQLASAAMRIASIRLRVLSLVKTDVARRDVGVSPPAIRRWWFPSSRF